MLVALKLLLLLLALPLVVALVVLAALYASPARLYRGLMAVLVTRAGLLRREVTLADGTRFVLYDGGRGEPLLLLHGFAVNKDNFLAIAPYLRGRHRLLIPDIPGFGESSPAPDGDYSPAAQVDRLRELLRTMGIAGPVHVGGSSMGGLLALTYGLRHGDHTKSLWLLDPAGVFDGPMTDIIQRAVAEQRSPFVVRSPEDLGELLRRAVAKPPYVPRPLLKWQARHFMANQAVYDQVFAALVDAAALQQEIAGMAIPTLIVWGQEDALLHPGGAPLLHALLPNSRLVMMPGIGHVPHIEAPLRVAEDLFVFEAAVAAAAADAAEDAAARASAASVGEPAATAESEDMTEETEL
ncbi:MAG: alpha/beta hydrolase [Nannocystaceae bacterium]